MGFDSHRPFDLAGRFALVVDNSVMMRWLFDDGNAADRRYALKVLNRIRDAHGLVIVPYLWVYEAAHVVNFYVEREDLEGSAGVRHLESLHDLALVIAERQSPATLFEFSRRHGLSAYDSAYLLLAGTHDLPIATLDRKMRKAATKASIEAFS